MCRRPLTGEERAAAEAMGYLLSLAVRATGVARSRIRRACGDVTCPSLAARGRAQADAAEHLGQARLRVVRATTEDSMKRRRHTPEQIIRKLPEADRLLAEGKEVPEVAKTLEISEATYHRWRAQYGGLKADDVKRLKELEAANARLKRIVADKELQIAALKELERGNW